MADVAVHFSEEVAMNGAADDSVGDKEFDDFLSRSGISNGSPSESKENLADGNGIIRIAVNGTSGATAAGANDRIKWKAKRPSKFALPRVNSDSQVSPSFRPLKNSRKSRNGFGRGLPKKGGAGGKGTWGALGSEVLEEEFVPAGALDPNDPNYDDLNPEDKDVTMIPDTNAAPARPVTIAKHVPDEEVCKHIHTIILEYYDHGDSEEAYISFEELRWRPDQRHLLVITAIELAMDHKPSHREMTSVLLADVYHHSLREHHYYKGYDRLIQNLEDLVIDTPEAPTILGNFIARSIADDCIPPKFLTGYKGQAESDSAAICLSRAQTLLSMRHGLVRLDAVWGIGGGTRPVKHLVKKMTLLLQEYLSANDLNEAQRCLVELEVPHFHHELIYEAIVLALEKMDDRNMGLITKLLGALHASVVVTPNQMAEGFTRVFEDLPQISLDVPPAHIILEKLVNKCLVEHIITDEVARKMPSRSRKRFVSEGDGGRIKDDAFY